MENLMRISDIFFPSNYKCIFCGVEIDRDFVCENCYELLNLIKTPCVKCGGEHVGSGDVCLECRKYSREFDKGYSVCNYDGDIKIKILSFKNHNGKYLGTCFSKMMYDKFLDLKNVYDYIIPIPIHKNRQKKRGFNQSDILAKEISKNTGKVYNNIMFRRKDTPHQSGLNRDNRVENLENAFELFDGVSVEGKDILLIDDIFTTGSTIDEASRFLKSKGALKVDYLCLARTPVNSPLE